jgi:cytochrome c biogenesis protein CcdA/thiol-disulfide isomerase/thioredoxin
LTIYLILFLAGALTILLPCILPLVPLVLGVSSAGQRRIRPLVIVAGMAASFVILTFVLQVALARFAAAADLIRISSTYVLLLFGVCFLIARVGVQIAAAVLGAFLFASRGWVAVGLAAGLGAAAVVLGGRVAARIQQFGSNVQHSASSGLGGESLLTAFIVGLTLGLVWVPCAGPALGFALALVRDQPGPRALAALSAYAVGAAVPLLLVGYGGQQALRSARVLNRYSGVIKQVAGAVLILSALGLRYDWSASGQSWLAEHTSFGSLATSLENRLVGKSLSLPARAHASQNSDPAGAQPSPALPQLPRVGPAPEFAGLGPWYNSPPLTLASLRGKVVLVDFWTYSCINCVRTLPYVKAYWTRFQDLPFVLIGIHTPEFVFEKNPQNVATAIRHHDLPYPIAQDNDYATWNAFGNRYWPAKYLIDAEGTVRYMHFGEGDYEETDLAIRSLLAELGRRPGGPVIGSGAPSTSPTLDRSPETYLGARGWPALANGRGSPDGGVHRYILPSVLPLNHYALVGTWRLVDSERQVLAGAEGEIRFHALAGEVNLVIGLEPGTPPRAADVALDGRAVKTINIDRHDLFNLWSGPYAEHEVALWVHGRGVAAYAFTFGQ